MLLRFLILLVLIAGLHAADTMPYRFQTDVDPATGLFVTGQLFDQQLAANPITDAVEPTGKILPPVIVTAATHPALFAALNAEAIKTAERITDARAKHAADLAAKAAEEAKSP